MMIAGTQLRRRSGAAAVAAGPPAVVLGLVAHVVSGGATPPAAVVLALIALVSLAAAAAARLPLPGWSLGVGSAVVQQILHLAFTALAGANAPLFPSSGHHHGSPAPPSSGTGPVTGQIDIHLLVVAHVAAALITALVVMWALAMAERPVTAHASRGAKRTASGVKQGAFPQARREARRLGVFVRSLVH